MRTQYVLRSLTVVGGFTLLSACTMSAAPTTPAPPQVIYKEVMAAPTAEKVVTAPPPPGVVQYVWEEPMTDVSDVPPGLDPEGHYWRPGHEEIVEVRQGRWKHYRFPDEAGQ